MLSIEMYQIIAIVSGAVSVAALLIAYFNGRALIRERQQADHQRKALLDEMRAISKGSIGVKGEHFLAFMHACMCAYMRAFAITS